MTVTTAAQDETAARSPAEVYEQQFVPALFRQWGPLLCEAARVGPGQRVLDVACGTGALTTAVAERVAPGGAAIGLDANPQMLAVARRKHAGIEWREGRAEALPFPDASFDAVVSQFGLMFFDDRIKSLREMQRVLRPGGSMVVAVCDALENSPGYAALAALLDRLFGTAVGDAFRSPFVLGDEGQLLALCTAAGVARCEGRAAAGHGALRFRRRAGVDRTRLRLDARRVARRRAVRAPADRGAASVRALRRNRRPGRLRDAGAADLRRQALTCLEVRTSQTGGLQASAP